MAPDGPDDGLPDDQRLPLPEALRRYVMKRYLHSYGLGWDVAEDLAATVMVKYAQYNPQFYRRWLERTIYTTFADYCRKAKGVHVPLPPSSPVSDPGAGGMTSLPAALLASSLSTPAANRDAVGRMLSALTPPQRAVVVARYWEDLSSREIAERLGYKNAAVIDTLLNRAEVRLRKLFPDGW